MVKQMRAILPILLGAMLSAAPCAFATTAASVPTLTITHHPERRTSLPDPKAMEVATRAVSGALSEFRRTANALRIAFETSPEYTVALSIMMHARARLDQARQATLLRVRGRAEYVQQILKIEKLELQLTAARKEPRELTSVAMELMRERVMLSNMEATATNVDGNITDLRQQYIDAAAMVSALRENFAQDLRKLAEWQTAKATYENAIRRRTSIR